MKPQVLVVGAGPVGLTMAAELARYGVGVRIVDKAAQRTDKSKALVLWSRTLELLDRMGCGASFVEAGRKVREADIISGGATIARVNFDGLKTPHPYGLMLPQSETERLMEQHLNSLGVEVERRVELIRFVADEDAVTAFLRRPDGGEETVDVDWMIGCDGAHSFVRHGLGMEFEGDTMLSHFILADLHLAGGPPLDEIKTYWHEAGLLVIFPIGPGRYRVVADAGEPKAGEPTPDPTLAEVQSLLDQRGPAGVKASDPVWLSGVHDQRAQGRGLSRRARVPRRRRGACPQPRRRAGDEHRACRTRSISRGNWRSSAAASQARSRCSEATAPNAARSAEKCWRTPAA